jgi:hypothetical protein
MAIILLQCTCDNHGKRYVEGGCLGGHGSNFTVVVNVEEFQVGALQHTPFTTTSNGPEI